MSGSKIMSDTDDISLGVDAGDGDAASTPAPGARNLETILKISVVVQVVLGSATMPVSTLLKLGRGAVIPLDHRVGEAVDVMVNGRIIARGEIVVVEDDNSRFGVSLTEIVSPSALSIFQGTGPSGPTDARFPSVGTSRPARSSRRSIDSSDGRVSSVGIDR